MKTVREEELHALATSALEKLGMLRKDAEDAARILVMGDLFGVHTHGVSRLESYAERIKGGGTKAAVHHREGIQIDLRVVDPDAVGAALQYFTGSKDHNVRLREMASRRQLKISEYGVFDETTGTRIAGATEPDVYAAVGLPWIPPELRENGRASCRERV